MLSRSQRPLTPRAPTPLDAVIRTRLDQRSMDDQQQRDAERGHAQRRCRFEAEGATSGGNTPGFGDCAFRTTQRPALQRASGQAAAHGASARRSRAASARQRSGSARARETNAIVQAVGKLAGAAHTKRRRGDSQRRAGENTNAIVRETTGWLVTTGRAPRVPATLGLLALEPVAVGSSLPWADHGVAGASARWLFVLISGSPFRPLHESGLTALLGSLSPGARRWRSRSRSVRGRPRRLRWGRRRSLPF